MPDQVLLGFDFGMKRIGVAVGQIITRTARPLTTVSAHKGVPSWDKINALVQTWRPDALVVGIPLNMDGTPQSITESVYGFIRQLKDHYELPVYEVDERLSTQDARQRIFNEGGYKALQNGQVDSVAAQLILQNWLELPH